MNINNINLGKTQKGEQIGELVILILFCMEVIEVLILINTF
jgi:hypothetical protein